MEYLKGFMVFAFLFSYRTTNVKNKYIMKLKLIAALFLSSLLIFSCSKNETDKISEAEQIQQRKISDIIPQKYLDTLTSLGLVINEGLKPPVVNGQFKFSPNILKKSNIAADKPGNKYADPSVKFYDQNNSTYDIRLIGRNLLVDNDTSISTAISGEGDKFTVYGKVRSTSGDNTAVFAIVFSGSITDGVIKNMTYGAINIDNSKGGNKYIPEGTGRIFYEGDYTSEVLSTWRIIKTPSLPSPGSVH